MSQPDLKFSNLPPFKNFPIKSRKGSALVTVIIFVSIMAAVGILVYKNSKAHRKFSEETIWIKRAEYVAKAGIQHALLKFRLLPTELYDAAAFSAGKNPYFNFKDANSKTVSDYKSLISLLKNPLPSVITKVSDAATYKSQKGLPVGVFADKRSGEMKTIPGDSKPPVSSADLKDPEGNETQNADLYLWKFRYDITSDPLIQPAISWDNDNADPDWVPGAQGEPFQSSYKVTNLVIKAVQGRKLYDTEALEITVEGTVRDLQSKKEYKKTLTEIRKVSRN